MNKVEFFFKLLRGLYGAGKIANTWPTEMDMQLAQKLWQDEISQHTEEELKIAIDNTKRMMQSGDDEWNWPNVGMILSGAKIINHPSHKIFKSLPEPTMSLDDRKAAMAKLRAESGL